MAKLLPIILVLVGLASGIGAGLFLRPHEPDDEMAAAACEDDGHGGCVSEETNTAEDDARAEPVDVSDASYVKLSKQFVVPVVTDGKVSALVVLSISLEVEPSASGMVFEKEPKLRDALLRVMFLHANSGGFEGQFTDGEVMKDLRGSLLEAAQETFGDVVYDVLVTDILRQDV